MDAVTLHLMIDYVGSSGVVLSPEQKATLQTALTILKNEQKFQSVFFWGIVRGVKGDYFIAYGVRRDALSERILVYSKDCLHWGLLPPATKENREKLMYFRGRFTGDPSHEFEHIEMKKIPGEGDEIHEEEVTISIKEEDRLAAVIAEIEKDAFIVPRRAYLRLPTGQVVPNRNFEGLTVVEAAKLNSYLHFRDPIRLPEKSLLERAQLDKAIDFLDRIEEDIPRGCWSLQFDRGSGLVLLKSLLWPGYVFYHVPSTRYFGSIYSGIGEYNLDLPFML